LTNGNFIKPTILIARKKPGEEKDLAVFEQYLIKREDYAESTDK
jgi:hypothetical protein